jgi:hypothetical protein
VLARLTMLHRMPTKNIATWTWTNLCLQARLRFVSRQLGLSSQNDNSHQSTTVFNSWRSWRLEDVHTSDGGSKPLSAAPVWHGGQSGLFELIESVRAKEVRFAWVEYSIKMSHCILYRRRGMYAVVLTEHGRPSF